VVQWAKPLLKGLGYSACWADGLSLRALAGLGSNPGLEGVFQLDWASGHAMRLNSPTGKAGSPVSSINCDRNKGA